MVEGTRLICDYVFILYSLLGMEINVKQIKISVYVIEILVHY